MPEIFLHRKQKIAVALVMALAFLCSVSQLSAQEHFFRKQAAGRLLALAQKIDFSTDIREFQKQLQYRPNPDIRDNNGATPLWLASAAGRNDVVQLLLDHGAGPDIPTNDGATPLWIATVGGHIGVVRVLMGAGAAVDKAAENGTTPLWLASWNGVVDFARMYLEAGADPNAREKKNRSTPLYRST